MGKVTYVTWLAAVYLCFNDKVLFFRTGTDLLSRNEDGLVICPFSRLVCSAVLTMESLCVFRHVSACLPYISGVTNIFRKLFLTYFQICSFILFCCFKGPFNQHFSLSKCFMLELYFCHFKLCLSIIIIVGAFGVVIVVCISFFPPKF